ncbi:MAG: Hsp20/alpha crystallin family protein [Candidatus Latescibacteria bacterium]|nr:Hsp20/alpha crystallin family protein [Candidatus Latescibacterota bacterium]
MTYVRLVPGTETRRIQTTWNPGADIVESKDGFALTLDVPGIAKEAINVKVHEGILTVSGTRKRSEIEDEKLFRYYERPDGSFSRSFRLPDFIDSDSIKASYENGVLKLEVQKKEEAKPHTITIK